MIANEAAFSAQVVKQWRAYGYFVQRIESGAIGRGIPDIYVESKKEHYWVELKLVHTYAYNGMCIPWRIGQQSWMLEYFNKTGNVCVTIVHCLDCILIIPMTRHYAQNRIQLADVRIVYSVRELTL